MKTLPTSSQSIKESKAEKPKLSPYMLVFCEKPRSMVHVQDATLSGARVGVGMLRGAGDFLLDFLGI